MAKIRNQIIEDGAVILDTMLNDRTEFAALHGLLRFHSIDYDPCLFQRRGDWVQFKSIDGLVFRTMSERKFG